MRVVVDLTCPVVIARALLITGHLQCMIKSIVGAVQLFETRAIVEETPKCVL